MRPTVTSMLAMLAAILLAGCAASPRAPSPSAEGVRAERVDETFDVADGVTRIALDNPWGMISVRDHDEREVGIHAVAQSDAARRAKATFRARRDGDTLRVEVAFERGLAPSDRIDVALYVPGDLALALRTQDGAITAKKRGGAIEADSGSGRIVASSRERLALRTRSGAIRAAAMGRNWHGASTIETDSGRIVLRVPTFGDIALDARTGGALGTDFGLSVHTQPDGSRTARARYGAGTSPLQIRSASGEIVLEQLVPLGEDTPPLEDDD
ncbi:hypothetical protein [Dokdonella sp.]|uniref:hypothetical protein n=1 Tax=Dokdonella sp. TaxID=2291710 RepID=UPI001B1A4ECA|nr:hypothetical protein [Dokdonella sp.]MBO9663862.1 hypothetical protein [Dokdonella sp.]